MVDFGSEQGLSDFETAGIARYSEDFKRAKTPLWAERCRLWMGTNWLWERHLATWASHKAALFAARCRSHRIPESCVSILLAYSLLTK